MSDLHSILFIQKRFLYERNIFKFQERNSNLISSLALYDLI